MTESSARPLGPIRRFFRALLNGIDTVRIVVVNAIFLVLVVVVISVVMAGTGRVVIPDGAALVLQIEGRLVERAGPIDPLRSLISGVAPGTETVVRDVVDAIRFAAHDERIAAIMLDLDRMAPTDLAKLQTLGQALEDFRNAGKLVLAGGDFFSQSQYFLASHADEVYLNPMGAVELRGFGMSQLYFAEAFKKFDVNVHVFRVGEYKAAVEPYLRQDMSDEARLANRELVESLWGQFVQRLAANRDISEIAVRQFADHYDDALTAAHGDAAVAAVEARLVDELLTRDQQRVRWRERLGHPEQSDSEVPRVQMQDYLLGQRALQRPAAREVLAVVVASGALVMDDPSGRNAGANQLTEQIAIARRDPDVRGILLRVDSPGGSAFASELIRQELELAQAAGIPVVASMGSMGASGGYWISATADEIWSEPGTITGSIGIFSMLPTFERALERIGVHSDTVRTGPFANGLTLTSALSPEIEAVLQQGVEAGYQRFLRLVARGRDMTPEAVDQIAQGRVWIGSRAAELGLVNEIGGPEEALASLARLAGLTTYAVRYPEHRMNPRDQLLRTLLGVTGQIETEGSPTRAPVATAGAGRIARLWAQLQVQADTLTRMADPQDLYLYCQFCATAW